MSEEKEVYFPAAPFAFDVKYETVAGFYEGTLRHDKTSIYLDGKKLHLNSDAASETESHYEIPYERINLCDAGSLSATSTNKIALECTPVGATRPAELVKIYVRKLSDIERIVCELKGNGVKIKKGIINHYLHSKYTMKYYSPRMRYWINVISKTYKTVILFGMIFFLTDVASYLPDIKVDYIYDNAVDAYENASGSTPVLAAIAGVVAFPFLFVIVIPVCLALVLAKRFFSVLAAMAALEHFEVILGMLKDMHKILKKGSGMWGKATKSTKEKKYK
ncbi:hypothetical protein SARC_01277 [Sphaeroforma arctica JP610]|uniref:Uncharacterized protein n=1 Tax=Sphaeroforma arctica JP610 TaxID=667725 RepID=A0A0L0GCI9_9EUKA|nr:hypothetical protein SARC_01277 [Sphaeroforma arctica JP610]KNC86596.1 hypothetical protein SARC_01277 [Sphaeroforma arctica JP610]|eukprot:XP_014160498.1 hypothetical protein SARC_01277 [Sphaeroforma arctica JP610]